MADHHDHHDHTSYGGASEAPHRESEDKSRLLGTGMRLLPPVPEPILTIGCRQRSLRSLQSTTRPGPIQQPLRPAISRLEAVLPDSNDELRRRY